MNDQVYQAVLDFYRASVGDQRLSDAASPMPPVLSRVLKAAAELVDKQPPEMEAGRGEELRRAVTRFAEQVLFIDHANYYRILGLNTDADAAQIKNHYRWLTRLLFPVSDVGRWNEADAVLLNRAYSVLRDPNIRKAYNEGSLNHAGRDKQGGVKRGAAAGGGQEAAGEDAAAVTVPGDKTVEEPPREPATARTAGVTQSSTFIAANLNRVNPTPFARVERPRLPEESAPVAAASVEPARVTESLRAGGGYPTAQQPVQVPRAAWVSVAVFGGVVAVGLVILVYLGVISLPFMTRGSDNRSLSVAINQPGVSGAANDAGEVDRTVAQNSKPLSGNAIPKPPGGPGKAVTGHKSQKSLIAGISSEGTSLRPLNGSFSDAFDETGPTAAGTNPAPGAGADNALPPLSTPLPSSTPAAQDNAAAPPPQPSVLQTQQTGPAAAAAPSSAQEVIPDQAGPPKHTKAAPPAKRKRTETAHKGPDRKAHSPHAAEAKSPRQPDSSPAPAREPSHETAEAAPAASLPASPPKPLPDRSTAGSGQSSPAAPVQSPLSGDLAMAVPPSAGGTSPNPSAPATPVQAVTEQQLEILIKSFISSYEAGDLDIFMSLFSADAQTKAQKSREAIRQAYSQFFQATHSRRLKLIRDLKWDRADDNTLVGRAPFQLTLNEEGRKNPLQFSGTLIFRVENRSPHLLIKAFDYQYQKNKE